MGGYADGAFDLARWDEVRSRKAPDAGWSSLVARRAHNPEVVGSNPTPAIECGLRNAECGMSGGTHSAFAIPHSAFALGG